MLFVLSCLVLFCFILFYDIIYVSFSFIFVFFIIFVSNASSQDDYHYVTTWYSELTHERIKQKDNISSFLLLFSLFIYFCFVFVFVFVLVLLSEDIICS